MQRRITRRALAQALSLGAAAGWIAGRPRAAELPQLNVNDPAAAKLGYVEYVAQIDAKKYPSYFKGSNCENCLQLQGKEGDPYRPCSLFPGKVVSVKGWCSGWAAEM